jgi:hypothetical protein
MSEVIDAPAKAGVRLCRDCRHAEPRPSLVRRLLGVHTTSDWHFARYLHPAARKSSELPNRSDLVTGGRRPERVEQFLCSVERADERNGHCNDRCGEDGQLSEAREIAAAPGRFRSPA